MWGSDFMPHDCSVVRLGCRSNGRNQGEVFGERVKVLDGNGMMMKEGNTTTSMRVLVGGTRMINGRVKEGPCVVMYSLRGRVKSPMGFYEC
jgi:hypothetical protein